MLPGGPNSSMLSPFQAGESVTDEGAPTDLQGLFEMAPSFHRAVEGGPMELPQVLLFWMLCPVKPFSMQPF